MLDAATLRLLSIERLEDARTLYEHGRYDGAAYICGYATELALKARVCDTLDVSDYPQHLPGFKIHDLNTLLLLSGRERLIKASHRTTWDIATGKWGPHLRYTTSNNIKAADVQAMIQETVNILPLL